MLKTRNITILVMMIAMLCGPCFLFALQRVVGVELPGWMTSEDAAYLSGAIEDVDLRSQVNLEGFVEGDLQGALLTEIGNFIPAKATAMLGNAGIQRAAIVASDSIFQWECVPSFYGCTTLYNVKHDSLMSTFNPACTKEQMDHLVEELKAFAYVHPDVILSICIPNDLDGSILNPSFSLTHFSDSDTNEHIAKSLQDQFVDIPNVKIYLEQFSSLDSYYGSYLKSDFHWNEYGAALSSNNMAKDLDMDPFSLGYPKELENVVYYGSDVRLGLCMAGSHILEPDISFSDILLREAKTGELFSGNEHPLYDSSDVSDIAKEFNFYSLYYGTVGWSDAVFGPGENNGILVCDSFGSAIERTLGKSFRELDVDWSLYRANSGIDRLSDKIEQIDAKNVFFVARLSNLATLMERYPYYLI